MFLYYKIKRKIFSYFIRESPPVDYNLKKSEIEKIASIYGNNILVETGTFLGDTVDYFKYKFKQIFSIELSEDLAIKAKKRFISYSNINIIHGDSGIVLQDLVKNLNSSAIFWLDGHYSSEFMVDDVFIRTAKGDKNTPIVNELIAILKCQADHIILIDDARLFNGLDDYPSIGMVKRLVKKYGNGYHVSIKNDIIYILK